MNLLSPNNRNTKVHLSPFAKILATVALALLISCQKTGNDQPLTSKHNLPGIENVQKGGRSVQKMDSIESTEEEFIKFFNNLFDQGHIESKGGLTTSTIKTENGEIIKLTKYDDNNNLSVSASYRTQQGETCYTLLKMEGGLFCYESQQGNNDPSVKENMESLPLDIFSGIKGIVESIQSSSNGKKL